MCIDNPPHKKYWRLYYLLDLIPPVTSKQVKWNFRKVTLRHHYYQAYLVLYNRSRKYFYDAIGEDAYGFIVSGTWGPIFPLLGIVGTTLLYTIVMLVEIAMLILFFVFLGARVDDVITWGWKRVVTPLMIFVCIAWLCSLFALVVSFLSPRTWREGMAGVDRISPVGNFCAACAYFCIPFVIGFAIREDTHAIEGKCLRYMVMPIIGDVLYYLTSLIWRWPRRLRMQMQIEDNETNSVVTWGIFFMAFLHMGCGIAQWVLIGKKIDHTLDRSWYVIFIPFCVRTGLRIAEACLRSLMKYYQGVRSQIMVAFDTVGAFFVNGILLLSLYFVAVRIERGVAKCRMARALIPVYITLAYMFLAMIVTMIYLLIRSCQKGREESRINNAWVPPQDDGPVLGVKGTTGGKGQPRQQEGTSSSSSGPIPAEVRKERDWDDFDAKSSPSSAAFPQEMYGNADPREPAAVNDDDDDEYDEFYSDEEEEVFPQERSATPRSHDEENEEGPDYSDEEDVTPREADRSSGRPSRRSDFPPAATAATDPRTEPTPAHSSRPSRGPRAAPAPAKQHPHDASTLTGDSEEEPESDYTYEYEDEEYTEQSGTRDDEDYEYTEYTDETAQSAADGDEATPCSAFSSSFASSQDVDVDRR